ncbi:RES family NAD+ phosphorylase [Dyella flagellata]|nr:RES family NAD+ phosphorylase [Dyella flagellata]
MPLPAPSPDFHRLQIKTDRIDARSLFRISRRPKTEPYFGKNKAYRFDDSLKRYGVCYVGDCLATAFAETILHDLSPVGGEFRVARDDVTDRFVMSFRQENFDVANLTGAHLKVLGGTNDISSEVPYDTTQLWSQAIYQHPDKLVGLAYISRHLNTHRAYALFDRLDGRLVVKSEIPILMHPELKDVLEMFNVVLY